MTIEFILSIAIRVVLYIGLVWYGVWKGRKEAVTGLTVPSEIFGPMTGYLAMPYLESGQVSTSVLLIISITSMKYVMEAALGTA